MMADFLVPLVAVGVAELGDKTQLSILLLSSKSAKHSHLLCGVLLAFLAVDGAAVLAGSWIITLIPVSYLKWVSAAVFIAFGILTLSGGDRDVEPNRRFKNSFISGFTFVFMAEWGDKTQVASALFAAKYNPLMVLVGTMTALAAVSTCAVCLGKLVLSRVERGIMTRVAGVAFLLVGLSFLIL